MFSGMHKEIASLDDSRNYQKSAAKHYEREVRRLQGNFNRLEAYSEFISFLMLIFV
jgi:chromosomal replication initiation ATPase DnaA